MGNTVGWIVVEDAFGQTGTVKLEHLGDALELNEIGNLKSFIEEHSDAKVIRYGVTKSAYINARGWGADETDPGKYDSVAQRLKFNFMDQDGGFFSFSIPAPRDEDLSDNQQPKGSVAKAVLDKIAELTSREADDLHYLGGGLVSKVQKIELRSKKLSS